MSADFRIEPLAIPDAVGAPGWDDFCAMVEVRNRCEESSYGTRELTHTAEELFPAWRWDRFDPRRALVARREGRIVGRAVYETQADEASPHAWLEVQVLPEHRGIGIGTALAAAVESLAAGEGRSILLVYAVSPDAPGERIRPPTGFGSVPAANREVRFLVARGYRLEQIARGSRLALPAERERVQRMLADARRAAGSDYRVVSWAGRTPPEHVDSLAHLNNRMSTDTPSAGLEEPEEEWTPQRVREQDDTRASGPWLPLTAAVLHTASDRLVAFSTLFVPTDADGAVTQDDTLVLREHRGRRLGTLVKLAALELLERGHPGHPSIITFNAEENRPMLDVNERIGFVPIGYEGAWRKDVPDH